MDDFNRRFAEVMQAMEMQVVDDNGTPMTKDELERFFNEHTIYEIDGKWYTRSSIFLFGEMEKPYRSRYKDESVIASSLKYYMLNDCNVSGLGIAEYDGKFGLFPLEKRTGSQSGIWCCSGYPFIYDDVKVYADWNRWDDFGYVAVKRDGKWGVIKVTQFPSPMIAQVANIEYDTPEEAMKAAGEDKLPVEEAFCSEVK